MPDGDMKMIFQKAGRSSDEKASQKISKYDRGASEAKDIKTFIKHMTAMMMERRVLFFMVMEFEVEQYYDHFLPYS